MSVSQTGRKEQGIAQIREGLDAAHAAGDMVWSPSLLTVLATAYGEAGQPEEGLRTLAQAFDLTNRTECAVHEPGLYHLKGELLLTQNDSDTAQAEYSFQSAMEIARKQGSRAWELREADRRDEARTMLADIYHWFTEGFDNVDFIDAKALLDELSG